MFKFGIKSKAQLATVEPIMQKIFLEAIKRSPIDFGIPQYGGMRTAAEQNELFRDGKSKLDGYKKKSRHQSGRAVDIYGYVNGKATWDARYILVIAGVIISTARSMGHDLRWGGDFDGDLNWDEGDSWDKVHFEYVGEL